MSYGANTVLVLQAPEAARQLFLLFHGVGARPQDMAGLGERLGQRFPQATVVSVGAPDASDMGQGWQWFSVRGVTEDNRPARVAATLPRFLDAVRACQARYQLGPEATTLIGFSQGAILSLAAAQAEPAPASRVVSLSGRFDQRPRRVPEGVRFHFIHGMADPVITVTHASQGAAWLQTATAPGAGTNVTLDLIPQAGHTVSATSEIVLFQRLAGQTTP